MTLTIFQDKALSGLLVGMTIVRLLKGELTIPRPVRRKIKGIRIDFLFLSDFGRVFSDKGLVWKDTAYDSHLHFFKTNDRLGVGLVVTDENIPKGPDRNIPVDNQKFFETFGKELEHYFKNEQEILELNTTRFDHSRIITYNPQLTSNDIKQKILYMVLEENEEEITINEFRKTDKAMGIILNNQETVDEFIVKKDDKIYCFDYKYLQKIGSELIPILKETYKN